MKRLICLFLIAICCLFCSCNRSEQTNKAITCDDVTAVYQAAGFTVFHSEKANVENGVCYVKATDPDTQEYIFFYFFDTHEQANAYAKTREYNVLIWLFSAIYGDPSWLTTKVYNQIEIEYDQAYLYEPFKTLIQS
ncbi:MAG: hypothetical protein J6A63_06440 [Clostridia bacterium]|nr:hypothetical protein [Clostridia bacterium]